MTNNSCLPERLPSMCSDGPPEHPPAPPVRRTTNRRTVNRRGKPKRAVGRPAATPSAEPSAGVKRLVEPQWEQLLWLHGADPAKHCTLPPPPASGTTRRPAAVGGPLSESTAATRGDRSPSRPRPPGEATGDAVGVDKVESGEAESAMTDGDAVGVDMAQEERLVVARLGGRFVAMGEEDNALVSDGMIKGKTDGQLFKIVRELKFTTTDGLEVYRYADAESGAQRGAELQEVPPSSDDAVNDLLQWASSSKVMAAILDRRDGRQTSGLQTRRDAAVEGDPPRRRAVLVAGRVGVPVPKAAAKVPARDGTKKRKRRR
eukprot:Selendium_serpulae@DN1263_c0_g1_i1.p1